MKLKNLRAIISGANQGFGLEIAQKFLSEGASIAICARNTDLLDEAHHKLEKLNNNNETKVFSLPTDIANPADVKAFVDFALEKMGGIDVLVANAGVYGTKGALEEIDWDEWSEAIDINLKGTVLQCKSVLKHFKQQRYGKIIILSGGGATKPMPFLSAYAASKAGVVRFAETLAEEVREYNIDVNTVAPGALNTRLLDEVLLAGSQKVGEKFYQESLRQKEKGGTAFEIGTALCTFLASPVSNGITGKLISAVWDPWQNLPKYIQDLKNTDVYTLRRIVPEDRGLNWENNL